MERRKSIPNKEINGALRTLMESGLIRIANEFDESLKICSVESLTEALTYYQTIRNLAKPWISKEVKKYDQEAEELLKKFRQYRT